MDDQWFSTDRAGLRKLALERGVAYALYELFSNAHDQNVTFILMQFVHMGGREYHLECTDDDPNGFRNLTHAYTLFAESDKKTDPTKAGRFNLGEKLVLAICSEARITTTTGSIIFNEDGTRSTGRIKRDRGSKFEGVIKNLITKEEWEEAVQLIKKIIPRPGVKVTINNDVIPSRTPNTVFPATLQTVIADEEGVLRRPRRETLVEVLDPLPGEVPMLFELGVPVVETKDKWHINVRQKVPLNKDRDNVPVDYLQKIRTLVVNHMHDHLTPDDVARPWVKQATESKEINPAAMKTFMDKSFGEKRVSYDPSDPEANSLAAVHQHTVVTGSMLSKEQWENAKEHGLIKPAGQVTPSPKAYSVEFSLTGTPIKHYPDNKLTEGMKMVHAYAMWLHNKLDLGMLSVFFIDDARMTASAAYCKELKSVEFNVRNLKPAWFELGAVQHVNDLLMDEFGHAFSDNHHSIDYHRALRKIGAKMFEIALQYPKKVRSFRRIETPRLD